MTDSTKPEPIVETTMPEPPAAGSSLAEVVRYYTEISQARVPGWDVELIPLSGKNPRVNGDGWQTLASSDARTVLEQVKAAGRVDGLGALMNRHIAFDVDHPEFLPPALASIFEEGLASHSRPGRTHYIFRVPDGMRFGGSKLKLDPAFGVLGKWGEIKAWNGQIRIWSPNPDDGTHVALVPGPIPMLPPVLVGLLLPPLAPGEMVSTGELDDWLNEHVETRHMSWLGGDVAKLRMKAATSSKYEAMNATVFHMAGNVAAGAYPGREAYDALLTAYKDLCEDDDDWDGTRLGKYQDSWRGAAAKHSRDPDLIEQARVRRGMYSDGSVTFDPENDETDAMLLGLMRGIASHEGRTVTWDASGDLGAELEDERILALAAAPSAVEESPEVPTSRSDESVAHGDTSEHPEALDASEDHVDDEPDVGGWVPRLEADEPMPAVVDLDTYKERLYATDQAEIMQQVKKLTISEIARTEYRKLKRGGNEDDLKAVALTPGWREIVPPDMLVRTDGVGLMSSARGDRGQGLIHNLIGGKGSGKTTLALYAALERVRAGERVVWIDIEMGEDMLANMMMTLRAPAEAWDPNRFLYVDMKSHGSALLDDVLRVLRSLPWTPNLIVLDSLSRAILRTDVLVEAAENSSQALTTLIDQFCGPAVSAGSAMIIISHTGHFDKTRTRGSSSIGQQVDVEYSAEMLHGWSREREGAALLTARKTRSGFGEVDEPAAVVVYSPDLSNPDPLRREMSITIMPPGELAAQAWIAKGDEESEVRREKVKIEKAERRKSRAVELTADVMGALAAGERISTNQVWKNVSELEPQSKTAVSLALEELLAAGSVDWEEGSNSAKMWGRK